MATKPEDVSESVNIYRKKVIEVFVDKYCDLNEMLEVCIVEFSMKAFAAKLITEQAKKKENFSAIFKEFKSGFTWKTTVKDIKEHYQLFIKILESFGSITIQGAANVLATKLLDVESGK